MQILPCEAEEVDAGRNGRDGTLVSWQVDLEFGMHLVEGIFWVAGRPHPVDFGRRRMVVVEVLVEVVCDSVFRSGSEWVVGIVVGCSTSRWIGAR